MEGSSYDDSDDISFILCEVCNAKIRGETQYKIHLTENQHLKKEDALIARGLFRREKPLPKWTSISQYIDYLQLDEPIIGLQHLVEVDSSGPGLRYLCRLCFTEADLPGITNHILSRKHRQKYLVTNRPDLVTWNVNNVNQLGKLVRAKAEVVERQDGRGLPEERKRKREVKPHPGSFRVTLKETPGGMEDQQHYSKARQNQAMGGFRRWEARREMTGSGRGFNEKDRYGQRYGRGDSYGRGYHEEDRDEQRYQEDGSYDEEYPYKAPYEQRYQDAEPYREAYAGGSQFGQEHLDEGDSWQGRQEEWGHHDDADRRRQRFPDSSEERKRERLVHLLRDCAQKSQHTDLPEGHVGGRGNRAEGPDRGFGYSRRDERRVPFDGEQARKPAMYNRDDGTRSTQFDGPEYDRGERSSYHRELPYRDDDRLSREDNNLPRKRMRPDPGLQKQVDCRRAEQQSVKQNILDVLNNIEIETMDEANSFQDKLCNLLEEFQANKSEKVMSKKKEPVFSKDYNHMSTEAEEHRGSMEWREPWQGGPPGDHMHPRDAYLQNPRDGYQDDPQDHYHSDVRDDRGGYNERPNSRGRRRGNSLEHFEYNSQEPFEGDFQDSAGGYRDHSRETRNFHGGPSRAFDDRYDRRAKEERLTDRRQSDDCLESAAPQQDYHKGGFRHATRGSREHKPGRPSYPRSEAPPEDNWSPSERPERSSYPRSTTPGEGRGHRRRASPCYPEPPFHEQPGYRPRRGQGSPTDPPPSSSLSKITSTLLQLVARKGSF
ncbi:uncharacterized protein [Paramormyrops kingsleyae]|uniref:uncharacterized protein n=1 Tax=Paramormyrops kingsleyae TaxID=1676925 RepID=UPI003B96DA12